MVGVKTMDLKGNKYAKVADRLVAFREANPRSKISTECIVDGNVTTFRAYVWKDKTEFMELLKTGADREAALLSADAEGSARSDEKKTGDKAFEKLETVAVGRALALLGYAISGEIASTEEMEEFEDYKAQKHQDEIEAAILALRKAKTVEELKKIFLALPIKVRAEKVVVAEKDKAKEKLGQKGVKKNVAKNGK